MSIFKKSTFLAAVMITAGSIGAMAQKSNEAMPRTAAPQVKTFSSDIIIGDQTEHPVKQTIYFLDANSNEYVLNETITYELDELGRPVLIKHFSTPDKEQYRFSEIVYNEEGRKKIVQDGNTNDFPSLLYVNKNEYNYDNICKDFVTEYNYYYNNFSNTTNWKLDVSFKRSINRDEQNRVIKVENIDVLNDFCTDITESTYGESSSPEKIITVSYNQETGEERWRNEYTDIDWYTCDNQILDGHQMHDIAIGNGITNKINKVYVKEINPWANYTQLNSMTYDDKGRITSLKENLLEDDGTVRVSYDLEEYTYTDDNGSFIKTIYQTSDWNNNNVIDENEIQKVKTQTTLYDEHKNKISYEEMYYNGDESHIGSTYTCAIEYDEEGRIIQAIEHEDDGMNPPSDSKKVYEYSVPTGIKNVEHKTAKMRVYDSMIALGTNAECAYRICNAEGKMVMSGSTTEGMISTASLPSGFYIVSVNNGNGTSSVKFVK